MHSLTLKLSFSHSFTLSLSQTLILTLSHSLKHLLPLSHSHSQTHSHTLTHSLTLSLSQTLTVKFSLTLKYSHTLKVVPVSKSTESVRRYRGNATHDLYWRASLPGLGGTLFFVHQTIDKGKRGIGNGSKCP